MTKPIISVEDDHDRAMKDKLNEEHPCDRSYRLGRGLAAYHVKHVANVRERESEAYRQSERHDDPESFMNGYWSVAAR